MRVSLAKGRTFVTTGPGSYATTCRSQQINLVRSQTIIFCCLAIERRIQDNANAEILGVNLAESRHDRDNGSSLLSDKYTNDDVPGAAGGEGGDAYAISCNHGKEVSGLPVDDIQFDNGGGDNFGEDVDEEVAAVNVNEAAANINMNAPGEVVGRSCPRSLPAFGSGGNAGTTAVSSSTSQGGTRKNARPRRSPSAMLNSSQKTKNSTNHERVSISKAIDRMVELLESGGGGGW